MDELNDFPDADDYRDGATRRLLDLGHDGPTPEPFEALGLSEPALRRWLTR